MRGLINALFVLGTAILGIVILYLGVAPKAEIRYKIQEGMFVDVARIAKIETRLRIPLDMERSRALEESMYFIGSFGGWYNPEGGVPNITNPFSVIFPEPLLYIWRNYSETYIPSEDNITTSFYMFYGGYFNYEAIRDYDPHRWYTLYKVMYPVRPEQTVLYEKFLLGKDIPESRIFLVGSPMVGEAGVGMAFGTFSFYPLVTARSKAPLYKLYEHSNESVQEGFLDETLKSLFEDFLDKKSLLEIYTLRVGYEKNGKYYQLPKYDYKTAVIVYLGKALCLEGIPGYNSNEFCNPIGWLESISCYNDTPGGKIYWCTNNFGKENGEQMKFNRNSNCDTTKCDEAFWKILKYYYYIMAKESGKKASENWTNVDLRIIPYGITSEVRVYEDIP